MTEYLFTSEAVSEGHPDKVADAISDAILDAYLSQDPSARVACETLVTTNKVVLAGEFRSTATVDAEAVVRKAIADIGYTNGIEADFDAPTVPIENLLHGQAAEIAQGVDAGDRESEGAGDQGLMFGYACNETEELMPAALHYCQRILKNLADRRKAGDTRLSPDAKTQLTLSYNDAGQPTGVHTALLSHQHSADASQDELRTLFQEVMAEELPAGWVTDATRILVNPTGSFVNGGPATDTGLTGRKIIVDTYGGAARHGGGAFSGKDPTKVDRSAAYAARWLAKNVVAAGLADRCEIQLCYAIGVPEPLAVYVTTFGTAKGVSEEQLSQALQQVADLTPRGLRNHLGLTKAVYQRTAAYGHFGRTPTADGHFSWEKTDLVDALKAAVQQPQAQTA